MSTPTGSLLLNNQNDATPGEHLIDGQTIATILQWALSAASISTISGAAPAAAPVCPAGTTRVAVVAAANDVVQLPLAVPGLQVRVVNDSVSNACLVYPNQLPNPNHNGSFDAINNAAGAGVTDISVGTTAQVNFVCYKAGVWKSST